MKCSLIKNSKIRIAIKIICFLLTVALFVGITNSLLMPKYCYNELWPTTSTYHDFYKLPKNSVDVLILGSSHAVCTMDPQKIYDNYGITSYNLGCEQQSVVLSYFWLREALKYQSPKVVLLDSFTFHQILDKFVYNDLNCGEATVRKAMDSMRFSPLKLEAVRTICDIDPSQDPLSFFLLNIRYHSRWTELTENDYSAQKMYEREGVKGFTITEGTVPLDDYMPPKDSDADSVEAEEMTTYSKIYLDKITELCEQKGIRLVIVDMPSAEMPQRYKSTRDYAAEHNLPFYDFSEEKLYNEIGYNASKDVLGHPNYYGAEKVSMYLGKLLSEEYGIAPRQDKTFEESRIRYEQKLDTIKLHEIDDSYEYLDFLKEKMDNDKYSIFLFAPLPHSAYLDDRMMEKLNSLGFSSIIKSPEVEDATYIYHYLGVKDLVNAKSATGVTESVAKEDCVQSGSIRSGLAPYIMSIDTSIALFQYHNYSLTIDGEECGSSNFGLNIIVYDNDNKCVIDKVNINTNEPGAEFSRY